MKHQPLANPKQLTVESLPTANSIIFYTALREGIKTKGRTESLLTDTDMIKAETYTKLADLGYSDIDIRAIEETSAAYNILQSETSSDDSPLIDIDVLFNDIT